MSNPIERCQVLEPRKGKFVVYDLEQRVASVWFDEEMPAKAQEREAKRCAKVNGGKP